ncbi:hypothetical protein CGMCC3_g10646 [Colletotrichum fructicola]|uniref:Uncharacterized protein n=1 Tax=Colletotrichum fructicola (strain Nara gc5) TaxID=1213859 RepID=A0A7J6JM37_COLFN|nr:uncharacterized protein CGMCC3_g10646 [Colletotrichum fructicola]KAE9573282.1 hypothetical protein CGMCC3_g10646 [Colletotrichum fructicola]KAF4423517.1 hypothetical protein CFRS1_v004553 [Colletotrichum fructicola]KAF4491649.1 hypothetical protein CGGC5_v000880 [Colletotrichum fructicola Nara gc5]
MEPDPFKARTLDEVPTHLSAYGRDAYQRTCLSMLSTGIHKWGFVIYRCTYDDDELWNRYLAQLKSFCHNQLVEYQRAELLEQYLDWVVIEDRATLNNASRVEVRKHFNQWVSEQNVPMFPTKAYLNIFPIQMPRFRYCLYVDKQCLNTIIQFQEANDSTALFLSELPPMAFAIVDRTWTPNGTQDEFDIRKALKEKEENDKEHGDNEQDDEEESEDEDEDEDEEDDEEDQYDRGYPLIDGSDRSPRPLLQNSIQPTNQTSRGG